MRRIWLKKVRSEETWDLLPQDSNGHYDPTVKGSPFVSIKGTGYKQTITQNQVGTEYFISQISTSNQSITGIMIFKDDEHIKEFQEFIGDFRNQIYLYYLPDGDLESSPYYKLVVIEQMDKTEKTVYNDYEISTTIKPQSDVWSRDVTFSISDFTNVGQALVYPYTYSYVFGGRDARVAEFVNNGRTVGCLIKIKNNGQENLSNIEWFIEKTEENNFGEIQEHLDVQRSKWNLTLPPRSELVIDSSPLGQEAKVNYYNEQGQNIDSQNVASLQEPSWDYINFINITNGQNRIVFYIENENVDISITYQEQKEIV